MSVQNETLVSDFTSLVGNEHLLSASPKDAVDEVQPSWVVEPGNSEEMGKVLSSASKAGLKITPRGNGTKLGWGVPPKGLDLIISTRRLDQVLEHAWGDMTATVQAGCTLQQLQMTVAEHGQRLALDPLWQKEATIGGILATNDSGSLRVRFGSLRDMLIGITIALPSGVLAKSGGKVVKNVAGYDLPKLMLGAWGTLGIITEATFRLYPLPQGVVSFTIPIGSLSNSNKLILKILDSTLVPSGVQIRAGSDNYAEVDVRFEGIQASTAPQLHQLGAFIREVGCLKGAEETTSSVWQTRDDLFGGSENKLVCKFSVLPSRIAVFCESLEKLAAPDKLSWKVIAQAVGVGLFSLEGEKEQDLSGKIKDLRKVVENLNGSMVILKCPAALKSQIDIWGPPGNVLPLMMRIKEQFDPSGTLNSGRFVGGI